MVIRCSLSAKGIIHSSDSPFPTRLCREIFWRSLCLVIEMPRSASPQLSSLEDLFDLHCSLTFKEGQVHEDMVEGAAGGLRRMEEHQDMRF